MFFYVTTLIGRSVEQRDLVGARLPNRYDELPQWVLSVLQDNTKGISRENLIQNVNQYLQTLSQHGGRSMSVLRRINWAILPLHWKPSWFTDKEVNVTACDSASAQTQTVTFLLQHIAAEEGVEASDLDNVKQEIINILGDITNIRIQDRKYIC